MLLIPIGAEEDGSRATPVVTIVLIAANVVWFLVVALSPGGSAWKAEVAAARADLETYWSEHPDLTPPESLVRLLGPGELEELRQEVKAAAAKRNPSMSWLDDLNRQELDRRARRLEAALANRPASRYGFTPARPTVGGALGSLFTHGGLVHLGGNMLFLWAVGPFVESALGGGLFLLLYLTGGIAALLTHWLASGPIEEPLVGASGAIAAVMGALLVRNAAARIRFFFLPVIWLPRLRFVFGVPALVVLPLWFLEQVASAALEPEAPVAWWAHIGGFVFGMSVAGALGLRRAKGKRGALAASPRRTALRAARVAAPRVARERRSRLRVSVVSTGAPGGLVVTRDARPVLSRALAPAAAGALALDETIELADGPADLRIEVRLDGGPARVASVLAVLKVGETRVLRIEPRPSGLGAELT